jgi:hypothetical protein
VVLCFLAFLICFFIFGEMLNILSRNLYPLKVIVEIFNQFEILLNGNFFFDCFS